MLSARALLLCVSCMAIKTAEPVGMPELIKTSAARAPADGGTNDPVRTIAEVSAAIRAKTQHTHFELSARALTPARKDGAHVFLAEDASGRELFFLFPEKDPGPIRPGALLNICGETGRSGETAIRAFAWSAVPTGQTQPPEVEDARISDVLAGRLNLRYVRITGRVTDAFEDDIDRDYAFLIVMQDRDRMYVPVRKSYIDAMKIQDIVGAEVTFRAIVWESDSSGRRHYAGVQPYFMGFDSIRKVGPLTGSDDIPRLEDLHSTHPDQIHGIGLRCTTGWVAAVWKGNRFLLRRENGEFMRVELVDGVAPPKCGDAVEAAGFVATDLFNVNLSRANWRRTEIAPPPWGEDVPTEVTADMLLSREDSLDVIASQNFGKLVSMDGTVLNIPAAGGNRGVLHVENGGFVIPVDASSCPSAFRGLEVGSRINVVGVFVFEAENWHDNAVFPKIDYIAVVLRRPEDLRVVSHPTWWTAGRLVSIIGILAVAVAATLMWGISLRVLAERRGRALSLANTARAEAASRSDERTRLAAELHDYIAQDLTAISYQISAAREAREAEPSACAVHLDTADRMIRSCKTELRRCLWDLKNEAIGDPSLANAIQTSISPLVQSVKTDIRIDIPRRTLSDNTVHQILSIMRELVSNAITHGRATKIEIDGRLADGAIVISVRDDGCGFDPGKCPDEAQGHFGLAGIRERAISLDGTFEIISTPGAGTCATIRIKPPPRVAGGENGDAK